MGPKKGSSNTTRKGKRKGVRTMIELKEIIAKFENCVQISDLATKHGIVKLTISTFLKNKDAIKAAVKRVTSVVSKQRP